MTKYQDLAHEMKRLWQLKSVKVIPVVVGALGRISKKLEVYVKEGGIEVIVDVLQKVALLGTARMLRQVFEEEESDQVSVSLARNERIVIVEKSNESNTGCS